LLGSYFTVSGGSDATGGCGHQIARRLSGPAGGGITSKRVCIRHGVNAWFVHFAQHRNPWDAYSSCEYRYTWLGKYSTCGQALLEQLLGCRMLVQRLLPILAAAARSTFASTRELACQTRVRDIMLTSSRSPLPMRRPRLGASRGRIPACRSGRNHMRLGRHSASSLLRAADCTRPHSRQAPGEPVRTMCARFPCTTSGDDISKPLLCAEAGISGGNSIVGRSAAIPGHVINCPEIMQPVAASGKGIAEWRRGRDTFPGTGLRNAPG